MMFSRNCILNDSHLAFDSDEDVDRLDSFKNIVVTRNGLNVMRYEKGITTIDLFDFLMNEDSLDY